VHRLLEDRETILTDFPTTNRRSFLAHGLRLLLAGPVAAGSLRAAAAAATDPTAGLSPMQWRLVAAVQEQLLPSEPGIPGAREVNAVGFLRLVMADSRVDASERKFIEAGVVELEQVCANRYSKSFLELTGRERGAALRQLEQSHSGHGWIAEMLEFLMEALLGDPSHGGNPAGVGWKWLGITPGFPRPPVD
jgi:gluconate 2-dehydrogenase gamma chain